MFARYTMSLRSLLPLSALLAAALVHAQRPISDDDVPRFKSGAVKGEGAVISASGGVLAEFGGLRFIAREGTIDLDKNRIELRRQVSVSIPGRVDHNLIRSSSGPVILTREPLSLSADEVTVTNGLLTAIGHVVIQQADTIAHGDRLYIYLRIGDGQLEGSVSAQKDDKTAPRRSPFRQLPPDIIK